VEEFARNAARIMEEGGRAMAAYLKPREEGRADDQYAEVTDVVKTLGQVADYWLRDPQRALELQSSLGKAYLDLWANAIKRMAGETVEPVVAPDPRDKRFADPEWSSNQFFDFLKQAYLLTVQWANRLVRDAEGLDPHVLQKADFYVRQISNAIAPSNFVLTNPELLRETLASKAENLVRGMHMLAEDIEAGHGDLRIRQSASQMFEVGRNLALTPGKVIFENELMQLIQYAPSTATVLFDMTHGWRVCVTVNAVSGREGMLTSTLPSTPAARAACNTRSTSPTRGSEGAAAESDSAVAPCPACSGSPAVATVGVVHDIAARNASTFAPAYVDHVRPVADRKNSPAAIQRPTAPCQFMVSARPRAPRSTVSRRASAGRWRLVRR
jgi:hypothetical protein